MNGDELLEEEAARGHEDPRVWPGTVGHTSRL